MIRCNTNCFHKTLFLYLVKYVNRNISFLVIISEGSLLATSVFFLFFSTISLDVILNMTLGKMFDFDFYQYSKTSLLYLVQNTG